jgi:hypothetical protein
MSRCLFMVVTLNKHHKFIAIDMKARLKSGIAKVNERVSQRDMNGRRKGI